MELPPTLRHAVDRALDGIALSDLKRAADRLSQRYRAEVRDGRFHLSDDLAARAYLATRLPATYAAVRASMGVVAEARPDFAPVTGLDVGAGPGTALWAAADCWPSLDDVLLVEGSPAIRAVGEALAREAVPARIQWRAGDVASGLPEGEPRDLVTLAYVLDELSEEARDRLVDRLWALTADTLLVVEPGTPAGWGRILRARRRLAEAGAHILAPCVHSAACPLAAPDWCHFSRRVARSRLHRLAKGGEVPWEDEKYAYVAVSRHPGARPEARIIAPPWSAGNGRVGFKLCGRDGGASERVLGKRDGALFKAARRLDWGDVLEGPVDSPAP
ncbi:small ribosomal subunit Rsm22 family protein [Azospirillum canadense]|uniref:small ribosomal subunit Rsm22 family protein n=1 Tax=Azospirillum canadense TaxID=403962 RepID=UPI0022263E6C|nr:small ribosomal subunit Rsm22 family protein [Azospirillum canadense]MCW2243696.1 ribosomal protein RSM22 (predicted rRNA methylase) [Azospirillum canadense]